MSEMSENIKKAVAQSVTDTFSFEPDDRMVMVERPRDPKMGDYSTNIAMRLAKQLHQKPVDIASQLIEALKKNLPDASEITIAGPGFINFVMSETSLTSPRLTTESRS